MDHPGATSVRRALPAALVGLVALVGAALVAVTVAPLTTSGDGSALAGVVVAALLLGVMVRLGATRARLVARSAAASPPDDSAVAPIPLRGRTTDPVHHPRRPRAPGRG